MPDIERSLAQKFTMVKSNAGLFDHMAEMSAAIDALRQNFVRLEEKIAELQAGRRRKEPE